MTPDQFCDWAVVALCVCLLLMCAIALVLAFSDPQAKPHLEGHLKYRARDMLVIAYSAELADRFKYGGTDLKALACAKGGQKQLACLSFYQGAKVDVNAVISGWHQEFMDSIVLSQNVRCIALLRQYLVRHIQTIPVLYSSHLDTDCELKDLETVTMAMINQREELVETSLAVTRLEAAVQTLNCWGEVQQCVEACRNVLNWSLVRQSLTEMSCLSLASLRLTLVCAVLLPTEMVAQLTKLVPLILRLLTSLGTNADSLSVVRLRHTAMLTLMAIVTNTHETDDIDELLSIITGTINNFVSAQLELPNPFSETQTGSSLTAYFTAYRLMPLLIESQYSVTNGQMEQFRLLTRRDWKDERLMRSAAVIRETFSI